MKLRVIAKLGRGDAALVGLVLLGAVWLFLISERGRAMRAKLGAMAEEFGPQLAELIEHVNAAGDRVHAFAIDRVTEPGPVWLLARSLATKRPIMTTVEIAEWLQSRRLDFAGEHSHRTATRAWLVRTACFEEVTRGR